MAIRYLLNMACTVTQRTSSDVVDEYGQPAPPSTATTVTKCWLDQAATTEVNAGLEAVRVDARIYLLPDIALDANDRISVEGLGDWEVVGQPFLYTPPPTNTPHHIEADCRKVNS